MDTTASKIKELTVYQNDPLRLGDIDWSLITVNGHEFSGRIALTFERCGERIDWNETPDENIDWEEAEDNITEAAWDLFHSDVTQRKTKCA